LKEKIGKFMERKECNAEGKTTACQKPSIRFLPINSFIKAKNKPYII
jgi:hypothetical protein